MPYIITRYSTDTSADPGWPKIINDGTVDSSLGINLLGRGKTNYGKPIAENFVRLLENFASNTPPSNAITGQLWYKVNDRDLYVCVSVSSVPVWQKAAKIIISSSSPNTVASEGSLFLEKIPNNNTLWVNSGSQWIRLNGVTFLSSQPTSANNGTLWYDLSNNSLKIFLGESINNWLPIITNNFDENGIVKVAKISGTSESILKLGLNGNSNIVIASNDIDVSDYSGVHIDVSANFPNGLKKGLNVSDVKISNFIFESVEDNISAQGSTPISAYPIRKTNNFVTSSTLTENGVLLPSVSARAIGLVINIWNLTSNNVIVYPPTGITINGSASDTILSNNKKSYILRNLTEYRIK